MLRMGNLLAKNGLQYFYIGCCLVGAFVPWLVFSPWVANSGLSPLMFLQQIIGHPVAGYAWLNILFSGVPFLVFVWQEGRRIHMTRLWLPFVGYFLIGLAFAIPLFLLMRELTIQPNHRTE